MSGSSTQPRCRLPVKVAAGSSADGVQGWLGDALKVRVTAAPERGKANAAVIEVLVRALGLPRQAIRIASGHTSPWKMVEIEGMTEAEVRRRLR
jgi:hypothetical protein